MSKKIIVACLTVFLFAPSMSSAQVYLEYGAKAGVNFSSIRNLQLSGSANRIAPAAGAFVTTFFSPSFAVQPEVLYMGKGDQMQFASGDGQDQVVTIRLSYLELPILAKLQGQSIGTAEVALYVGPSFSLQLNEDILDSNSTDDSSLEDVQNIAKGTDVGATIGAELGFRLGEAKLLFDLRLTPGLSSIGQGTLLPPDAANQTFSIMTGFAF